MKREMTYKVFIDDKIRPLDIFLKTNNPQYQGNFFVAKSYNDFIQYVEETFKKDGTYPGFVSFDYLLSNVTMQVTEDYSVYQNDESYVPTGIECASWLVDFLKKNNLPLPKYIVHEPNQRGRTKISKIFSDAISNKVADPFSTPTTPIVPVVETVVETVKEKVIEPEKSKMVKVEKPKTEPKNEKKADSHIDKTKDKQLIISILCDSLSKKNLTKKEIDELLTPKLSDSYEPIQKKNKIENVMWELKLKGIIVNEGTIRVPSWKLVKNEENS